MEHQEVIENDQIKDKNTAKVNPWAISVFLILLYLLVAMSDNFKGIFVPSFKAEFDVNNTQIGYVMTASLFAYAVFQYVGGILIEKLGFKKVFVIGFVLSISAIVLLVNCVNFPMLIASMFLLNVGAAMFNINVNTLGPAVPLISTAVLMNVINGSYGAGNTVLQLIAGKLLASGIQWRTFFVFMLIMTVIMFVYVIMLKIPEKDTRVAEVNLEQQKGSLFLSPMIYLYICAIGFYLAAEYNIGNWFVNYMREFYHMGADQAANYSALFWGAKTIGLFIGGFVADRLGYFRSIKVYGTVATLTSVLGIALGSKGLIIFSLGGFAYSLILPTLITTISGVFKEKSSRATGIILMVGTLLSMVVSQIIGILNDVMDAQKGFYTIPFCIALCIISALLIEKNKEKN